MFHFNILVDLGKNQHAVTDPLESSWPSGPWSLWGSSPSGSVRRQIQVQSGEHFFLRKTDI